MFRPLRSDKFCRKVQATSPKINAVRNSPPLLLSRKNETGRKAGVNQEVLPSPLHSRVQTDTLNGGTCSNIFV